MRRHALSALALLLLVFPVQAARAAGDAPQVTVHAVPGEVLIPPQGEDPILVIVNTDHWNAQESNVRIELPEIGFEWDERYEARDLLTGAVYEWHGPDNFVRLDPWDHPAHVFALRPLDRKAAP